MTAPIITLPLSTPEIGKRKAGVPTHSHPELSTERELL
jgi:hypothetical protein